MTNSKYSNEALRAEVEKALHIDWAFKGANSRPDKIIVQGTPKGAYHTSYKQFVDNMVTLLEQTRTNTIDAAIEVLPERPHRPAHNEAHMRLDCAACMLKKAESNLTALIGGDDE